MLRQLAATIRKFGPAREGVAAVEFALVLPIMLTMYIGSIELSQAFSIDERVVNIAGTVGDLVARADGSISATTLAKYFGAAQAIIGPYPTTSLAQVVTVVAVDSTGKTNVEWSQAVNGGTVQITNKPYAGTHPIPSAMTDIAKGGYIVVSEASYTYPPMLGLFFKDSFKVYHQNFYMPRYEKDITYDPNS